MEVQGDLHNLRKNYTINELNLLFVPVYREMWAQWVLLGQKETLEIKEKRERRYCNDRPSFRKALEK